jgi:ribosome-associated translation inhibitor RaiA
LDKYSELKQNVERALADMQNHYKDLAFSKIYMNRESIKKIDRAIVEISAHLKQTHAVFNRWCSGLVKI